MAKKDETAAARMRRLAAEVMELWATDPLEAAVSEIALERTRQVTDEGYSLERDDGYKHGELLRAAVMYYQNARGYMPGIQKDGRPSGWPWPAKEWKPKTARRDLERAGALCLAEIIRLQRIGDGGEHAKQKLNLITRALAALGPADA